MKNLNDLIRPNIYALAPYSCARNEFKGLNATAYLDANENPYNSAVNRYPDPLQLEVKAMLAPIKGVKESEIFLGNGSDEAIDLVYRIFCRPGKDNVVAIEPTYGMYEVCADINDVEYRKVLLDEKFDISADKILAATDENTKVIWFCTPNNPTGNSLNQTEIDKVLKSFDGIVVVDEAYSDFSASQLYRNRLAEFPNLIVLNTFSKAWASAAIRLGIAFASPEIIGYFNNVKYPYNVNILTQKQAIDILKNREKVAEWVKIILSERSRLIEEFGKLSICKKIYPSDANFILAEVEDANATYNYLIEKGIIVRNRNKVTLCKNCLRITVGNPEENDELLNALK